MAVTKDVITETRHLTRVFTPSEREQFVQEMFREENSIAEQQANLDAYKEQVKAEIGQHEANLLVIKNKLRIGNEQTPVQCIVKYDDGKAKYYRKDTGEFIDERPMSDREQMSLAGGFIDAEQIIRADSAKADKEAVVASFGGVNLVAKPVEDEESKEDEDEE